MTFRRVRQTPRTKFAARKVEAPDSAARVTMLELFFDLVFVFLVTQLTGLITESHGWVGYGHAALVLAVTWWMYDGFAWLANNVAPTTTATRLPMLLAMACFLAMAVVVPEVFDDGAWIFALAYLVVVTIHAVQFSRSSLGNSAEAIRRVLPINYGASGLLLLAAALGPRWGWLCWVVAVVVLASTLVFRPETAFTLRIEHFAERHRLLVIIALGETIIATGVSAQGSPTERAVLGAGALAMVLISALWWIYYAVGDDERGLQAMEAAPAERRSGLAFLVYSLGHVLHIAGLVLVAAGLHEVVHDPAHHLGWDISVALSAGAATFLIGQAAFRSTLRIGPVWGHLAAAVAVLAIGPLGVHRSGMAQLLGIAVILVGLAALLQRQAGANAQGDDAVHA